MSTAKAANVTKYDAGGSGDNVVSDGFIKTVEKLWIDSYTIGFTDTNCTLSIANLPPNKKITGLDAYIYTSASQTSGTVSIGFSTDSAVDTLLAATTITHNATATTISLFGVGVVGQNLTTAAKVPVLAGFQKVTAGTQVTVAIKLNNWTMTTGTVKTIVRYT